MEVMANKIYTRLSESGAKFNGGDYDFATIEYRDWWTGTLVLEEYWSSSDFNCCPWGNGFGCAVCREDPWPFENDHERNERLKRELVVLARITSYDV